MIYRKIHHPRLQWQAAPSKRLGNIIHIVQSRPTKQILPTSPILAITKSRFRNCKSKLNFFRKDRQWRLRICVFNHIKSRKFGLRIQSTMITQQKHSKNVQVCWTKRHQEFRRLLRIWILGALQWCCKSQTLRSPTHLPRSTTYRTLAP